MGRFTISTGGGGPHEHADRDRHRRHPGASSWEATSYSVTNLAATNLVMGDNVLAVEVHQTSATSSDVVFGMSLTATVPGQAPITITSQPADVASPRERRRNSPWR